MPQFTTQTLFPDLPPMISRRVKKATGLVLGPRSIVRATYTKVRDCVEETSACISKAQAYDRLHDAALANAEHLTLVSIKTPPPTRAAYVAQQQAILRDIKAAQAADNEGEDPCIYDQGWSWIKRALAALECVLTARRGAGKDGR